MQEPLFLSERNIPIEELAQIELGILPRPEPASFATRTHVVHDRIEDLTIRLAWHSRQRRDVD
jgi:hypothetical protein